MKALVLLQRRFVRWTAPFWFAAVIIISGCSSDSGSSAGVGTGGTGSLASAVALDVTDAPALDYAHVYITVTGVAFHTDASTAFSGYSSATAGQWQVVTLASPQTIDLAQLTNGTMYADLNNNTSLFSGISLPAGSYRQIRIFLASTEDAYAGSVSGLIYNNEVQLNGDSAHYPLRVPSPGEGIRVVPESPLVVSGGSSSKLALDFNLNDDVVRTSLAGATEFLLKPRLGYFDMASVGAVTGTVSGVDLATARVEVKAEQVKSGATYRIVRRTTAVDQITGAFALYPLPVFGNATTASYDILLRGRNVETAIVRKVQVHKGTTPGSGATALGAITMQAGGEFTANLGAALHPTGSWLSFYQTISGDQNAYEVRYRHLNPFTGVFPSPVELSTGAIHVATYVPGGQLSFTAEAVNSGRFSVVAGAPDLYDSGAAFDLTGGTAGTAVTMSPSAANQPQITASATAGSITCIFDMALLGTGTGPGMGLGNRLIGNPPKGQIFVTNGGLIIDSLGDLLGDTTVNTAMFAGGGMANPVLVSNLPGNVAGAVYGVYALGWGNSFLEVGKALAIDLRKGGGAAATIRMR